MTHAYDQPAPKNPTNISVASDLLAKVKYLKPNLLGSLENALDDEKRKAECAQWHKKNQEAIDASNRLAEERRLFADSYRTI
jgi:antitoxin CcdA